jgi:hypothetical protein
MDSFASQFGKPSGEALRPISKIEQARQAGYSELEIFQYLESEIKLKRQQGMTDADLPVHLLGDASSKSDGR